MAELNLKQIMDRLNEEFTGDTRKLVLWYDDKAEGVSEQAASFVEYSQYGGGCPCGASSPAQLLQSFCPGQ